MLAAIDLSLRSAGIVVLTDDGKLEDYCIVSNKELQEEDLITKNSEDILNFIFYHNSDVNKILIEGLSFASISSSRDLIAGNFWCLRSHLKEYCKIFEIDMKFEIVPVTRWRKGVIPKERSKELKLSGEKKWQKKEVVRKLPNDVKEMFENYIQENKLKKDSIYDLADAYWLGIYGLKS